MGLLNGHQLLLERQTLILLGLLRIGTGCGKLVQRLVVHSGLLGELTTVAPVLKLPSAAEAGEHQRQRYDQPPRHRHYGTSLKKT